MLTPFASLWHHEPLHYKCTVGYVLLSYLTLYLSRERSGMLITIGLSASLC